MEACLTRARTADNEHIFIDIVLRILVSAHHDALSLGEQNVLVKLGVDERGTVLGHCPNGLNRIPHPGGTSWRSGP